MRRSLDKAMMTKIAPLLTQLVTVLVCSLSAAPALAQRDRVFVASYGSDSNPCTFGSPCKTFQQAIDVVAQGGEVTAIDSAGFGTITISHSVTITSPNGVEAGIAAPAADNAAITINPGSSDIISLNGLTLDGDGVTGATGIQYLGGGSLNVQNCVIRNFETGIFVQPAASTQLAVLNTLLSNNETALLLFPLSETVTGVLNRVAMINNASGALVILANGQVDVTVSDSVIANNGNGIGVSSNGGTPSIMVRNSKITDNTTYGLDAAGSGATIWVTRSAITGNGTGWETSNSGTVTTFSDNNIVGNGGGNGSPSSTSTYQ
jgi:hypothetical protein